MNLKAWFQFAVFMLDLPIWIWIRRFEFGFAVSYYFPPEEPTLPAEFELRVEKHTRSIAGLTYPRSIPFFLLCSVPPNVHATSIDFSWCTKLNINAPKQTSSGVQTELSAWWGNIAFQSAPVGLDIDLHNVSVWRARLDQHYKIESNN